MIMKLFSPSDREQAKAIGDLVLCNPFLIERIQLEKLILKDQWIEKPIWSLTKDTPIDDPNSDAIFQIALQIAKTAREGFIKSGSGSSADLIIYEKLVFYILYYQLEDSFYRAILKEPIDMAVLFEEFQKQLAYYYHQIKGLSPLVKQDAHLFSLFFQVRRAFHFTFRQIFGSSNPAASLRAQVWQSIFSHDLERYRTGLYHHMHEFSTLITGPSGTGKELVAQAIGFSRYIPFDKTKNNFTDDFDKSMQALNLAAMAESLVESELFGHKKGAYTGAMADRIGYLECRHIWNTLFLDEIGDLSPALQVKLLRVLQTRSFQRLGENKDRRFEGKIIAATNLELATAIQEGRFREDLYYRLCADLIQMPSLAEQVHDNDNKDELTNLVFLLAEKLVGEQAEALSQEVVDYIQKNLDPDYPWPGNMRELEQCVKNILLKKQYVPLATAHLGQDDNPYLKIASQMKKHRLNAQELLSSYITLLYQDLGSYEAAARLLHLDRRTVKRYLDSSEANDLP
jgi:transcriptional regulator with GAF, ATPase, and Fis domain